MGALPKSERPVAIVTGAARGIGKACALALAAAGFHVLVNDAPGPEDRAALDETAGEIHARGGEALPFPADVADLSLHQPMIEAARARWGRLDCLVNNAGVGALRRGDLLEVSPESFDTCLRINTRAVFFLSQAAARALLAQGSAHADHRSIVTITSSNAHAASISRGEYCVSKCASSMTTKLFAMRLAASGIGVYEVRPGIIETRMTEPVKERYDSLIAGGAVPMNRWGLPAEVASAVCAMAQGRFPYTVGQAVIVDGGLTMPHF